MLQSLREKTSGPVAIFIVGLIAVPFAFFGIEQFSTGGGDPTLAKVGDQKEMGGVMLVAVERDGQIKWEPVDGIDSVAGREAQRRAERDEARWVKDMEATVKDARVQEAKEIARKERARKAELFGAILQEVHEETNVPLDALGAPLLIGAMFLMSLKNVWCTPSRRPISYHRPVSYDLHSTGDLSVRPGPSACLWCELLVLI